MTTRGTTSRPHDPELADEEYQAPFSNHIPEVRGQSEDSHHASSFVDAGLLAYWTAQAQQPLPTGQVFWLPTPASAGTAERALEQACRQQLMQDAMDGTTCLRVLYGAPAQQLRALLECLQALAVQQTETSSLRSGPDVASALQHGHAPNLRCRECVDPASEQRLFSRLLGVRKIPGNDAGQP